MKIIEHYTESLTSMGLKVDEETGKLMLANGDVLNIEGDDVVIPLKELQKKNEWDGIHPYHPLCEDVLLGMSDTHRLLQRMIEKSISVRFVTLISSVLSVAVIPSLQKQCKNPKSKKFLTAYPNIKPVDEKGKSEATAAWKKVYDEKLTAGIDILRISLHREKTIDGELYLRTGTIWSPLLDAEDDKSYLFGVKVKSNTLAIGMRNLITAFVEPLITEIQSSAPAPYYDVLMRFYVAASKRYNELLEMFEPVVKLESVDLSWEGDLDEVDSFRRRIPELPGNAGTPLAGKPMVTSDEGKIALMSNVKVERVRTKDVDDAPPWSDEPTSRRGEKRKSTGRLAAMLDGRGTDDDDYDDRRDSRERTNERRVSLDRSRDRDRDRGRSRTRDSGRGGPRERGRDRDRDRRDRERDSRRRSTGPSLRDMIYK